MLLRETTKLQSRSGTVTPPPSPTSGQTVAPVRAVLDVEGLATGTSEVCTATLEVLAHLFSWIDLSASISSNLLDTIFSCAKYHDAMVGFFFTMTVAYIYIRVCIRQEGDNAFLDPHVEWQADRNGRSSLDDDQ